MASALAAPASLVASRLLLTLDDLVERSWRRLLDEAEAGQREGRREGERERGGGGSGGGKREEVRKRGREKDRERERWQARTISQP